MEICKKQILQNVSITTRFSALLQLKSTIFSCDSALVSSCAVFIYLDSIVSICAAINENRVKFKNVQFRVVPKEPLLKITSVSKNVAYN